MARVAFQQGARYDLLLPVVVVPDPTLNPPLYTVFFESGVRFSSGLDTTTQTSASDDGRRAIILVTNGMSYTEIHTL
jgi:hypothetical protein